MKKTMSKTKKINDDVQRKKKSILTKKRNLNDSKDNVKSSAKKVLSKKRAKRADVDMIDVMDIHLGQQDKDFSSNKKTLDSDASKQSNQKKPTNCEDAFTQFFYTNDKFISQFDDTEIIKIIQNKIPTFMSNDTTDASFKKDLCSIFQDKSLLDFILERYDITIQDFFKFLFRLNTSVFKGPFIQKIRRFLNDLKY